MTLIYLYTPNIITKQSLKLAKLLMSLFDKSKQIKITIVPIMK